jgi:hypothetical protein
MLPTQRPPIQPTPVVRLTFCSSEKPAIWAFALAYAVFHALPKSGTTPPRLGACSGPGGLDGSVSTNAPGTGVSVGTGKGVNGTGEIGMVRMARETDHVSMRNMQPIPASAPTSCKRSERHNHEACDYMKQRRHEWCAADRKAMQGRQHGEHA